MSALIWNVRGLNIKARRDVKEQIARIKLRKLHRFQRCIPTDWLYRTNHNHSEGESLSWDPVVWSLNFIASFDQQITFSAHNSGGLDILSTIVYVQTCIAREFFYGMTLKELFFLSHLPWLVIARKYREYGKCLSDLC